MAEALSDAGHQDELAIFRTLFSFNEPEIAASLKRYFCFLYDLLEKGLAHLGGIPADSPAVKRGAALLTDAVWAILTAETGC